MVEQKENNLKFHYMEEILELVTTDKQNVIIVVMGVGWCYPAAKSLKHASKVVRDKVKVFLVNQEKNRAYCKENDIIVGTPVTLIFYNGKQMLFSKGEFEPTKLLKGQINPLQFEELINSTFSALEMKAEEIHVVF